MFLINLIYFSELLQCLDMCENDPVAIAHCFVDKVRKSIFANQRNWIFIKQRA